MLRFTSKSRGLLLIRNLSQQIKHAQQQIQRRSFSFSTSTIITSTIHSQKQQLPIAKQHHLRHGLVLVPLQKFSSQTTNDLKSNESQSGDKKSESPHKKPHYYLVAFVLFGIFLTKVVLSTESMRKWWMDELKDPNRRMDLGLSLFIHNFYAFSPETIIKEGGLKLLMKVLNYTPDNYLVGSVLLKMLLEFDSVQLLLLKDGVPDFVKMIKKSSYGTTVLYQIVSNKKNHQALLESESFLKQLVSMSKAKDMWVNSYLTMERFFVHRHLVETVRKQPLIGEILKELSKQYPDSQNLKNMIGIYNGDLDPWMTSLIVTASVKPIYGAQSFEHNATSGVASSIITYLYCSFRWKRISTDNLTIRVRSSVAALSIFLITMLTPSLYIRSEAAHKQIDKNLMNWITQTYNIPQNLITHHHTHNPSHTHRHNPTHNVETKNTDTSLETKKTDYMGVLNYYRFSPSAITATYLTCNGLMSCIFLYSLKYSRFVVVPQLLTLAFVLGNRFVLYWDSNALGFKQ